VVVEQVARVPAVVAVQVDIYIFQMRQLQPINRSM
jgi:hypothetical protein